MKIRILKFVFSFTVLFLCLNSYAHSSNTAPLSIKEIIQCIDDNTGCNGRTPIDLGTMHISPTLDSIKLNLGANCGLKISYFHAKVSGHSKIKMPNGEIMDHGKFEFYLRNDYHYRIFTIKHGKDESPCHAIRSWSPDDGSPRIENIKLAQKLVNPNIDQKTGSN